MYYANDMSAGMWKMPSSRHLQVRLSWLVYTASNLT